MLDSYMARGGIYLLSEKSFHSNGVSEKAIAVAAYKALQKYDIAELPSITLEYAIELSKWQNLKIVSLQKFCHKMNFDLSGWLDSCEGIGKIYYYLEWDCYAIFYNSDLPTDLLNWTLSTAIAYIELGLVEVGHALNISEQDITENFCYYFAAPDPVLLECDIRTASKIIDICQIPFQKAFHKSKKLKSYNGMAIEEGIKKLFSNFIKNFKI